MNKKLFLCDFDGTLVNKDLLDVVCGIVGKEEESHVLNLEFINGKREGLPTLKKRIDFLKGVSIERIKTCLSSNSYLIKGAEELFQYLKNNNYISVLHSGNLVPILEFYKELLGIDYLIGTSPRIQDGIIQGIELEDFNGREFKVNGCKAIIEELGFEKKNIIALDDSPSGLGVFGLADTKIAINPKANLTEYSDYVVEEDLNQVVEILKKLN